MFSFRYHGNYVGPGWSAGRYQPSVSDSSVPAVDEFDRTAKQHDAAYARKRNLKEADYRFYKQNIGKGFKRSIAALAVGAQGFLRKPKRTRFGSFSKKEKPNMPPSNSRRGRSRTPSRGRRMSLDNLPTPRSGARSVSMGRTRSPRARSASRAPVAARVRSQVRARRKQRAGASASASGGFFGSPKTGPGLLDAYQKLGIVYARENGNTIAGSLAQKFQSIQLTHTTK